MDPEFTPILLLIALLAVFYLVVIRPARRQQQATATVQRNLEVGDDVVLSSGIFGTVAGIDEARVRLEVAPGVVIAVARQAVVRRVDDVPDQHQVPAADQDQTAGEDADQVASAEAPRATTDEDEDKD